MTPQEFQHIKRVVEALESGQHSAMDQHKMLMTVSQITERAADKIVADFEERVNHNMANDVLVDSLKTW